MLIIGLGQIGMGYDMHLPPETHVYTHARAFHLHPSFHLVGAVDPDKRKCSQFEETYHVPGFVSLNEALDILSVDVVVIASPTQFHGEILFEVLKLCQPKAVMCEKPLSYDVEEGRRMVQMCETQSVALYVNYMRRSDPGAITVKQMIDSGEVGGTIKGVAWYSKGFLHNGSHFFNLLEYWLGEVQKIEVLDAGRSWNDMDPEPDVRVVFDKGIVVFFAAWEEAFSHYTIELLSPNGRLRYEREGALIEWQSVEADAVFEGYRTLACSPMRIETDMTRFQMNVVAQLANAIEGNGKSWLCTGSQALNTIEVMSEAVL